MAALNQQRTRGATHRRLSTVLRTATLVALCLVGLLAGYVVGSVTFYVAPLTLALAVGLVLVARTVAGPWWRPLLWGSAVGLCFPFVLGMIFGSW